MQKFFLKKAAHVGLVKYMERVLIGAEFEEDKDHKGKISATAFYSWQAYHSPGISLMACLNSLARYFVKSVNIQWYKINVYLDNIKQLVSFQP